MEVTAHMDLLDQTKCSLQTNVKLAGAKDEVYFSRKDREELID